jgi:chemotaxis protein CheD
VRTTAASAPAPEMLPAPEAAAILLPAGARVYLAPGRLYASAENAQVTTILGSCVAVCLFDPALRIGGINHFLLPLGAPASPRFGDSAIGLLVDRLVELGADRRRLKGKVFGGACVLEAFRDTPSLGARNVEMAEARLAEAGIPIVGRDVGGFLGRKVVFDVGSGAAWVRPIEMKK